MTIISFHRAIIIWTPFFATTKGASVEKETLVVAIKGNSCKGESVDCSWGFDRCPPNRKLATGGSGLLILLANFNAHPTCESTQMYCYIALVVISDQLKSSKVSKSKAPKRTVKHIAVVNTICKRGSKAHGQWR